MALPEITDTDQLQALLADQTRAPDFALIYIELCIAVFETDLGTILSNLSTVTPLPGCTWQPGWGPATDADGANLAMVATAFSNRTGRPLLHVVVIRGTDISDKIFSGKVWDGDLKQLAEDLGVGEKVNLPWMPPLAKIAKGTAEGLASIQGLRPSPTGPQQTLGQFLAGSQTGSNRPSIAVTGHSLGGCLTSVVAPWLANLLPGTPITATSFAGPSAGNVEFTAHLASVIPVFSRYFSTLDVIPNWWASLRVSSSIYDDYDLETPWSLKAADDLIAFCDRNYAQPGTNMPIEGVFQKGHNWFGEAGFQHHAKTYRSLLRLASVGKGGGGLG
jgi:triacylglycerol lipase